MAPNSICMTEHPSDYLGVNISTETRACNAIVVAMSWRNSILYFVVTVTVTCLRFSHGNVFDSEIVVQRPSSSGRVELRGGRQEPMAPTRHGLLTFKSVKQSGPKLPHGELQIISLLSQWSSPVIAVELINSRDTPNEVHHTSQYNKMTSESSLIW